MAFCPFAQGLTRKKVLFELEFHRAPCETGRWIHAFNLSRLFSLYGSRSPLSEIKTSQDYSPHIFVETPERLAMHSGSDRFYHAVEDKPSRVVSNAPKC